MIFKSLKRTQKKVTKLSPCEVKKLNKQTYLFRYKLINVFIFTFDRANLLPIKVNKPEQKITAKTIETIAAKITKAHTHTRKKIPHPRMQAERERELWTRYTHKIAKQKTSIEKIKLYLYFWR